MKASNLIKTTKGRRYIRDVAGASPYCEIYVKLGNEAPNLSSIKKAKIDPRRKKDNGVVVRTIPVVKVGADWVTDSPPFNPKTDVPYLRETLKGLGYNVSIYSKPRRYRIFDGSGYDTGPISIIEFRKKANKLRKLKMFGAL